MNDTAWPNLGLLPCALPVVHLLLKLASKTPQRSAVALRCSRLFCLSAASCSNAANMAVSSTVQPTGQMRPVVGYGIEQRPTFSSR